MTQNEEIAENINDLVKINNDRIAGYQRAIDEAQDTDADLKGIFSSMVQQSQQYRQELSGLVAQLGQKPEQDTRTDGKIYRAWMDIKATFSGNSRKSVLENCEFGEDAALKAYKSALSAEGDLSLQARTIIQQQQQALKTAHDKIKALRDQA